MHRLLGDLPRGAEVAWNAGCCGIRERSAVRTAISGLEVRSAASLGEALAILRDDQRTPIAGATDLYVSLNFGTLEPRRFLDIWAVNELRDISMKGTTLVIGALATYTSLIHSPLVAGRLPMLVEASRQVGGPQIQNRGTLGGNVANASPAGDSLPVLAAVDAVVVLRSADAERRVPITKFYTGYRATVMHPNELIVAIEVPPVEGRQWFRKVGTRAAQAISKIVVAGVRARVPRIAFGSVAPTVVRVPETERSLAAGATIDEAARVLSREIVPIDDLRSTAEYRMRVATNLLRRFWIETG
jgi:xanthine dehydrogenase small subunit